MTRMILFDLDGTLLPMNQDEFTGYYFGILAKKMAPYGYEAKEFMQSIWDGVKAMVTNRSGVSNEEAFWDFFKAHYGEEAVKHRPIFEDFYANDFGQAKITCGRNETALKLIEKLKEKKVPIALATNPIFPEIATMQRIAWAGLDPKDFELITTYENSFSCKPNPAYYREVLTKLGVTEDEYQDCLMIGNDVDEDVVAARSVGLQTYLITDCMINKHNVDLNDIPHGSFEDLVEWLNIN